MFSLEGLNPPSSASVTDVPMDSVDSSPTPAPRPVSPQDMAPPPQMRMDKGKGRQQPLPEIIPTLPITQMQPSLVSKVSLLSQLRRLYGPDAQWTCKQQREAVKALVTLDKDVILALRTGIGKTAVAIIPSMVENGYTVIVVPLIALMEDWKRRLTEKNIAFEHFKGRETSELQGSSNIILVSSDVAKYDHWKKCITQLDRQRPVLRMIIDEAHYYFTDVEFRSHAMANSFTLRHLPMQMVLMSGTIPPQAEAYLKEQFILRDPIVIRTWSVRMEIEYIRTENVKDLSSMIEKFQSSLEAYKRIEGWNAHDRYLVFTPFMEDGFRVLGFRV